MRTILVSVCVSIRPKKFCQTHENFTCGPLLFICKDWGNAQSILITFIFFSFSWNFASKGFMSGYTLFWACLCVWVISFNLSARVQNIKIWSFERFHPKNYRIKDFKWYDQDSLVIANLLVCVNMLNKVCSLSYHDVSRKKLHLGPADFRSTYVQTPPPVLQYVQVR